MKIDSLNRNNVLSSMKMLIAFGYSVVASYVGRRKNSGKVIWLITERPDQARDNGYCFFRYMRERHPEREVYYVIDEAAEDYEKIKKYGNVIQFDSWKHYYCFCRAKVHISAHTGGCVPSNCPVVRRIKKWIGYKDAFVPHGVSYGVSEFCLKKYTDINLFCCCGRSEYDNVLANYGYSEREVALTGFPRLDYWYGAEVNPKQILLMPTWRLYLAQNQQTVIEETEYFRTYQSLINSRKLAEFLAESDCKLIFYLHHDMQKYAESFQTDCSSIEIVYDEKQYDIQELLKSSALLITDYSSVHFDFAYMEKPVLYYQFDRDEFYTRQYEYSGFEVERDGFGPVAFDEDALIDNLIRAYGEGFTQSGTYRSRMRAFYTLHDQKNCNRVYEAIKEMEQ